MKQLKRLILILVISLSFTGVAKAQFYEIANQIPQLLSPALSGNFNYKGYVEVSYLKGVGSDILQENGAVSAPTAKAMASGARKLLNADVAVSVTGLAGPGSDGSSYPVGTVFIGYADANVCFSKQFYFRGDREFVRTSAVKAALTMILENAT